MQSENHIAFKEWAVIGAALEAGRQTVILRKGGIHEGNEGFRVQHREFWLFPTQFHQGPEQLTADAAPYLDQVAATAQQPEQIPIHLYAEVSEVLRIDDAALLGRMEGLTILSAETIAARFQYRQPGLFVLPVRVYRLAEPVHIANEPRYAGCRSWVELTAPIPTGNLRPVLSEDEFTRRHAELRASLRS